MLKGIGVLLVLAGAWETRRRLLAADLRQLRLGRELCRRLDLLEQGIFRLRLPLPELLARCEGAGGPDGAFWRQVRAGLAGERSFPDVWREAAEALPPPYRELMLPLGEALTAGERRDLLLLTREEVRRAVEEKRRRKGERDRLVTALCLSAGALLAVVLL